MRVVVAKTVVVKEAIVFAALKVRDPVAGGWSDGAIAQVVLILAVRNGARVAVHRTELFRTKPQQTKRGST